MPKYLTRVEFESMKVLRKRGGTIKEIGDHMHLSYGAVSRNLKYNSYEDYCLSTARGQKKRDALNGPVKIVKIVKPVRETKVCNKCGKEKPIDEFDTCPQNKDGHTGKCKACRRIYQRRLDKRNRRVAKSVKQEVINSQKLTQDEMLERYSIEPRKVTPVIVKIKKPEAEIGKCVLVDYKGKVKAGHIIGKCYEEFTTKWVVELKNWRKTRIIVSNKDIYMEKAC